MTIPKKWIHKKTKNPSFRIKTETSIYKKLLDSGFLRNDGEKPNTVFGILHITPKVVDTFLGDSLKIRK